MRAKSPFKKGITEKTKAEDGEGKSVTGSKRVAIEESGEDLVVILLTRNNAVYSLLLSHYGKKCDEGRQSEHTHFQNVGLNAMVRAETWITEG